MPQCDEMIRRSLRACVPIYVLVGLPGSGKTTYAEKLYERTQAEVYNADAIREELYGDAAIQGDNKEVFKLLYRRAKDDVSIGCPIILDNTNISVKDRKRLMNTFKYYNCKFIAIYMDTPIEECKRRNAARNRVVPDFVYDRMAARFVKPTYDEGFAEIYTIKIGD